MTWTTLMFISLALATDAFAVAMVCAIQLRPLRGFQVMRLSIAFGLFQGVMPVFGWLAGRTFHRWIAPIDHWVALALLSLTGVKMILSASSIGRQSGAKSDPTVGWSLLGLSVATSIDAMAVGLMLSMLQWPLFVPTVVIALTTAVLTTCGMLLGARVGPWWAGRLEAAGGIVLIAIGIKIVLEHTILQ